MAAAATDIPLGLLARQFEYGRFAGISWRSSAHNPEKTSACSSGSACTAASN